jgi:adenine-specific DNA-methyltransferase
MAEKPLSLDLGFKVFKLDTSNIRAWSPDPDDLAGTLHEHTEHLAVDRSEADVLYELLLKLGLDLAVPIEARQVEGKDVHAVGSGTLFACLAESISRDDVEALAQAIIDWHKELAPEGETTIVFRDSGFADDVAKSNLAAILVQAGFDDTRIRSL